MGALDAAGVSVERGREARVDAKGAAHEVQRAHRHVAPVGAVGARAARGQVGAREQRLVVEHLLEVRHVPVAVDAVAREAAAEVVVETAARHRVQRPGRRAACAASSNPRRAVTKSARGNLGAPPNPPFAWARATSSSRSARRASARSRPSVGGARWSIDGDVAGHRGAHLGRLGERLGASGGPRVGHRREEAGESDLARAVLGRVVGAREERVAVGREEHRHRPAAVPGHRAGSRPCNAASTSGRSSRSTLMATKPALSSSAIAGSSKRLVGHHVAPVARGVAHRQEHREVEFAGALERVLAPGPPLHRVVHVLGQVRRRDLVEVPQSRHVSAPRGRGLVPAP